jgi:hypothetical protein
VAIHKGQALRLLKPQKPNRNKKHKK